MSKTKDKKPSKDQLAKGAIVNYLGIDPWLICKIDIPRNIKSHYAVIFENGIEIYEYDKKVIQTEHHLWSEWSQISIDHFFAKSIFSFKGNKNWNLKVLEKRHELEQLIKSHIDINVEIVNRVWWRKILGFRSKSRWKMITASFVYLLFFIWVVNQLTINSTTPVNSQPSKQINSANTDLKAKSSAKIKADQEAKVKADAEAKARADAENKAKLEQENLSSDYVKSIVVKSLGSDKTNNNKDKVVEVQSNDYLGDGVPKGSKIILLTLNGNENLTDSMTKKGLWMDTIPVMKALFQNPKVYEVSIGWQLPMVDQYGNNKDDQVMQVQLIKPVADKINWDNFLFQNIPDVSQESGRYWEHPALSKIDTN